MGGAAIDKIVDALLAYGLAGIVIIGLAWWVWKQNNRIIELTDKIFDLGASASKIASDSAASNNRLADMLSIRREAKGE